MDALGTIITWLTTIEYVLTVDKNSIDKIQKIMRARGLTGNNVDSLMFLNEKPEDEYQEPKPENKTFIPTGVSTILDGHMQMMKMLEPLLVKEDKESTPDRF
jgi:hypothetical protein